jgi:hypothetical protein
MQNKDIGTLQEWGVLFVFKLSPDQPLKTIQKFF